MSEFGHGAQIVKVIDHQFVLDNQELQAVLQQEESCDLPAVLVSVAGAYRGGKSFLLNFFLRYLMSPPSARADGSWLGESGEPLQGFSWRSGSTRNTTGILMWSEPVICTLPNGNKVAVLLMDTQGTFDNVTTINENTTIFALSTLLSSLQIFNLKHNIPEDKLQHLHLFTEYGKLVRSQGNGKAFQDLVFLVRDWEFEDEYPYGAAGGQQLLNRVLQDTPTLQPELKEVRAHIRSCFEKVSCFLMPHPGLGATKKKFKGNIDELSEDFKTYLKQLVNSIFRPEYLQPKVMNGKTITVGEIETYITSYLAEFGSGKMPETSSIMKATTEAGLLTLLREGTTEYERNMEHECGKKTKCVPAVDIKLLHDRYKELTLNSFNAKKKMGSRDDAKRYYDKLSKDIDSRLEQFTAVNAVKQKEVAEAARNAYDNKIKEISKGELFCVHDNDVEAIHNEAFKAAMDVYDAGRKRITSVKDPERDDFTKSLANKYQLLRHTNEINTLHIIGELRLVYWQYMEKSATSDSAPSKCQLQKLHQEGLAKVLAEFKKKRIRDNSYTQDVYQTRLIEAISKRFTEIKTISKSVNRKALNNALLIYKNRIDSAWDHQNQHLHPDDLMKEHNNAKCEAIKFFRPDKKDCSLDTSDEDENSISYILAIRYNELVEKNVAMNKAAIQSATNAFNEAYEERRRPSWWWLLVVPVIVNIAKSASNAYYNESVEIAKQEFYRSRRNRGPESTDTFLQELLRNLYEKSPKAAINRMLKSQ